MRRPLCPKGQGAGSRCRGDRVRPLNVGHGSGVQPHRAAHGNGVRLHRAAHGNGVQPYRAGYGNGVQLPILPAKAMTSGPIVLAKATTDQSNVSWPGLSRPSTTSRSAVENLSIIIPVLNAETTLAPILSAIAAAPEIIVIDGGSTDRTAAIAAASGARVLTAPRGRGSQIAAGIAAATRPWLLILHADTKLQPGWQDAVAAHQSSPNTAGYFRFALDPPDPRARRLERLVAWRCRVLGLPYGDQGLLIHRDLLHATGGMKPLPLMEDVDLVCRLGRHRLVALDAGAITSAARWERDGYLRRSARNLLCLSLWFLGVRPDLIRRIYG